MDDKGDDGLLSDVENPINFVPDRLLLPMNITDIKLIS